MNKYALDILNYAFNRYQKSGDIHCSFTVVGTADDLVAYRNAARNLESNGYIENCTVNGLVFSFDINTLGIEYMSSYREP